MKNFKGQTFVFLGRSGAGKGTQTNFLKKFLKNKGYDVIYIYTGEEGRKLAKTNSLAGLWVKSVFERGAFFPDWMAIHLWFSVIQKKLVNKEQVIIFDGTPRKMAEAEALDNLMKDFKRPLPMPIYLDIDNKEAQRRLLNRGRADDTLKVINSRLRYFTNDVLPIINSYGKKRVLEINGEGSIEEVWGRIERRLAEI